MATQQKQQQGFVFTGWHMLGVMVLILALGIFLPRWDLGKVAIKR